MKKNISKIALKTDKIVSLMKGQMQVVQGGRPGVNYSYTCSCNTDCHLCN